MNETVLAIRWYLAVQVFGLAGLPLGLRLFRHLPDRGYGLSKALGLLNEEAESCLTGAFNRSHLYVPHILPGAFQ